MGWETYDPNPVKPSVFSKFVARLTLILSLIFGFVLVFLA